MSANNIHSKYRTPIRYPTIISIVPPGVALIVTFRGSNYRCLEQIFMVPKRFEPSKFDCNYNRDKIYVFYRCKAHYEKKILEDGGGGWVWRWWRYLTSPGRPTDIGLQLGRGWSGVAKVSCILCHRGVQLILAYSWAGGGRVWRRCRVSYVTGASNWYWFTVGQGLLSL